MRYYTRMKFWKQKHWINMLQWTSVLNPEIKILSWQSPTLITAQNIMFLVLPINQFVYHPPFFSFFFTGFLGSFKFYGPLYISYVACLASLLNCIIIYIFIYEHFFIKFKMAAMAELSLTLDLMGKCFKTLLYWNHLDNWNQAFQECSFAFFSDRQNIFRSDKIFMSVSPNDWQLLSKFREVCHPKTCLLSLVSIGSTDMKILSDRKIFCRSEKKAPKNSLSCA
jgi:hypothetical protein